MKEIIIFLLIIFLYSCNNKSKKENLNENITISYDTLLNKKLIKNCEKNKKLIDYYSNKGNMILPNYDYKLFSATEYYAFKKYGLVRFVYFGYLSEDSCSTIRTREILKNNKKLDLIALKKSIDSFNFKSNSNFNSIVKHYDGIYSRIGKLGINNMNDEKYNELLKNVLKKDSTFRINGFWLVIDKNGKIKKIENYIKHSDEIDKYVKDFLNNYKWELGRLRKSKNDYENVEIRTEFILKHYEEHQFPQLPAILLD
jgi:hypothetical protein